MFKSRTISEYPTLLACLALLVAGIGCSAQGEGPGHLALTSLMGPAGAPAAGQVEAYVQARVTLVDDPDDALGGMVQVDDELTGSYIYDENAVDNRNDPQESDYLFETTPFGINLEIGNLIFATDPSRVEMTIELYNDVTNGNPPGPKDRYDLRSRRNLDVLPGERLDDIYINLADYTASALSSDSLASYVLDIADWGSLFKVTLLGGDWTIEAEITSISENAGGGSEDDGPGNGGKGKRFHNQPTARHLAPIR